ncbi:GNAT family N-acetyltransferase [Niveibacterium terrae]|uniref:GNAT family N-acetyltransferase n=1 Tax=Niveibacterium terrae TaxID=3373598 RepID=UPI003A8EFC49
MEYAIRPATIADFQTILSWITSAETLKLWGGPSLSFPPAIDRSWREIEAGPENAFVLVDQQGLVVGFGQTLLREPDAVHLGRIIVAPTRRGQGVGRHLCKALLQLALERQHPSRITLNVYRENASALSLYTALGFVLSTEDPEKMSCSMYLTPSAITC